MKITSSTVSWGIGGEVSAFRRAAFRGERGSARNHRFYQFQQGIFRRFRRTRGFFDGGIMKTLVFNRIEQATVGGPDVLVWKKAELAPPETDRIRVRVLAAGIGFADILARKGKYILAPKKPFTPGYELVGEIYDWGELKEKKPEWLKSGRKVAAVLPVMAGYAEYISLPVDRVVPINNSLDPVIAAAVPLNYLTAVSLLDRHGKVNEGDSVLIHGASGGVGEALCQLGQAKNLNMYGTASRANFEHLEKYGVKAIDYKTQDFVEEIKKREPEGLHAVFDPISEDYLKKSYQLLKKGGVLVSYAFAGKKGDGGLGKTISGVVWHGRLKLVPDGKRTALCSVPFEVKKDIVWYRKSMEGLFEMLTDGIIKPTVSHVIPMKEAGKAQMLMESREKYGKVILTV